MRIGIIGHFGGDKTFNDGQTVKTIAVYDALKRYGIKTVDKVDTYYSRRNPTKFCCQFLGLFFRDKKIIVLLSDRGRKTLFPVLYLMSRLGKEIYHYGIGGNLAREVHENKKMEKYVAAFKGNWLESAEIANQLQMMGIKNAVYLPNFKKLNILREEDLRKAYGEPYKLCTFSRVTEEKGIEDAIAAVHGINSDLKRQLVVLDIYGPSEDTYLKKLHGILQNAEECRYCGVVPANKSVEALKDYFALLFPTHCRYEGIPGTIIDSLSAGVPVISRRWQYCDEILQHGETGYIYDFDEPEKLKDWILYAVTHTEETMGMKKNCLRNAFKYSEEYVIKQILEEMKLAI